MQLHTVYSSLPVSDTKLKEIRAETEKDTIHATEKDSQRRMAWGEENVSSEHSRILELSRWAFTDESHHIQGKENHHPYLTVCRDAVQNTCRSHGHWKMQTESPWHPLLAQDEQANWGDGRKVPNPSWMQTFQHLGAHDMPQNHRQAMADCPYWSVHMEQ